MPQPIKCCLCREERVSASEPVTFIVAQQTSYSSTTRPGTPSGGRGTTTTTSTTYKLLSTETVNMCNSCRRLAILRAWLRRLVPFLVVWGLVIIFLSFQDVPNKWRDFPFIIGVFGIVLLFIQLLMLTGSKRGFFPPAAEEYASLSRRDEIMSRHNVKKVYAQFRLFDTPSNGDIILFSAFGWDQLKTKS